MYKINNLYNFYYLGQKKELIESNKRSYFERAAFINFNGFEQRPSESYYTILVLAKSKNC